MNAAEIARIVLEGAAFVAQAIAAFIDGDDSEPVRRVIDILPGDLRASVELERQRELTRRALVEQFGKRDTPTADS